MERLTPQQFDEFMVCFMRTSMQFKTIEASKRVSHGQDFLYTVGPLVEGARPDCDSHIVGKSLECSRPEAECPYRKYKAAAERYL